MGFRPFQDALRAGTGNIMCSYNKVNNSYACQNSKMLNGILKTELGFQVCQHLCPYGGKLIGARGSSFRIGMACTLAMKQLWLGWTWSCPTLLHSGETILWSLSRMAQYQNHELMIWPSGESDI